MLDRIRRAAKSAAREAHGIILGIVLIGSWARGEQGTSSDIDLVVLVSDLNGRVQASSEISTGLAPGCCASASEILVEARR
jgi:predicted nucleotidyltransferase